MPILEIRKRLGLYPKGKYHAFLGGEWPLNLIIFPE